MDILNNFFIDYTFRIVAIGCTLLGFVSGIVGSFAVLRKQSLLGDALSHAALPGICLAFILTNTKKIEVLLLGAIICGILCITLLTIIQKYTKIKYDSALGFVLSVFFGFGLVLLSYLNKLPGANKSGLTKFIFGQASTLMKRDINIIIIIGLIMIFVVILFWKEIKLISFDFEYAKTIGYPVREIDFLISLLVVITVIIGIQAVGIILISALLISPAVAARQWTNKLNIMIILSGIFGGFAGMVGTLVSMHEKNIPTGPVVVVTISIIVIFSILFSHKRGIIFKIISYNKKKKKFMQEVKKIQIKNLKRGDK